jgi:Fuc2NAc and GlcNAc transferase
MPFYLKIIILSLLLVSASFILTYLIRQLALRNKFLSIPNYRSLHDEPVPQGGGLAIVIVWYTGISVLFLLGYIDKSLYMALLSGILLAVVSLIDDLAGLSPFIRLIVHFITSVIAFALLGGLRPLIIPGWNINYLYAVYPLAVIGMVWFINLFNFMDGSDGFASLEAVMVSAVMFAMSGNAINLVLIASVAGFLYWNWPKAKIFMGDVGSTQLGFILVVLGIYFHNTLKFSILNWIMLTSPFWFDATLTLFRRWRNGEKLSRAHKKHIYQRIIRAGFTHSKVNLWLFYVNSFIVIMILIYREIKILQVPLFILSLIFFYIITREVDKKVPFEKDIHVN